MSVLDDVLEEEYKRILKIRERILSEYAELPKGYISVKEISGKKYNYLQYRDGKKIVSRYIKPEELEDIQFAINRRRIIEEMLKNMEIELKKIERVVGKHEL